MSYTVWKREHPNCSLSFECECGVTSNVVATKSDGQLKNNMPKYETFHMEFKTIQELTTAIDKEMFEFPIQNALKLAKQSLHLFNVDNICGIYYFGSEHGESVSNLHYGPLVCLRMWVDLLGGCGSVAIKDPEAFILSAADGGLCTVRAKNLYDDPHEAELTYDLLRQCNHIGSF